MSAQHQTGGGSGFTFGNSSTIEVVEPKLYYFNPNTYGQEWFVAAYSRDEAIEAVKAHIRAENAAEMFSDDHVDPSDVNDPSYVPQTAQQNREERLKEQLKVLDYYVNETKREWDTHPRCIEEHPIGKVIQTEIS